MTHIYRQARARGSSGSRNRVSSMNSSRSNQDQGGGNKKQGLAPSVRTGQFSLWNGMGRAGIKNRPKIIQPTIKVGAKQDVGATKGSQRVKLNVIENQNEDVKLKHPNQSAELEIVKLFFLKRIILIQNNKYSKNRIQ